MPLEAAHSTPRVLIVHQSAIIGGAEHSIELWITHMPRWIHPIVLLGESGPLADRLLARGVDTRIMDFPPFRASCAVDVLAAVWKLYRLAKREGVALIHSNTPRTNLYSGLAGRLGGVPVLWHARNLIYGNMRDLDRVFSFLPTRIVAISKAVERRFHRNERCPSHVVTVLHGIDTDRFSPDVPNGSFRGSLGIPEQEFLVGLVGRIGLGKGHGTFVRAAREFFDEGGQGQFLVIGGAQQEDEKRMEAEIKEEAERLGLDGKLRFTGFRSDMPAVMADLDVVALCTEAEPLGRVVLEGMASGRAVVASRSGGVPELLEHERNGWLVPPNDAGALAEAFLYLERHPDIRRSIGLAARARAVDHFSLQAHVTRMTDVYQGLIDSRRK